MAKSLHPSRGAGNRLPAFVLFATIGALLAVALPERASAQAPRVALSGHVPGAVAHAAAIDRMAGSRRLSLSLVLPLRNQAQLADLVRGLYDPADPRFGRYLTPEEFAAGFGPTQADYDSVAAFAQANGLTVTGTTPNRVLLNVDGAVADIERTFGVRILDFRGSDGRQFYAPDGEPTIPAGLGVRGVIGLDDSLVVHPASRRFGPKSNQSLLMQPSIVGTGPGNGLSPSDFKTAYNLTGVTQTGAGQTLGLFELDDYKTSDITAFESRFGLPNVPISGGGAGSIKTAGGQDEVTLDIDMAIAMAPNLSQLYVYEVVSDAQHQAQSIANTWNSIATLNQAKQVSTSWWMSEGPGIVQDAETTAAQQMAAQGQSVFSASGDFGAYGTGGPALAVQDPPSNPWFVAVGGTDLTTNGAGGTWSAETSWADPQDTTGNVKGTGGGGGISGYWTIPGYQQAAGVITAASLGSTTMRNVPDVALYGDYDTGGYSIAVNGAWIVINGTSASAPLWAGFNALVNQQRLANGLGYLGFPIPAIYSIAQSARYASDFHDIADNSNNLFYPAVTGYDLSTGWGSFIGSNLLADLATYGSGNTTPSTPANLTATAGNQTVTLTWTASTGGNVTYNVYRGTSPGAEGTTPIAGGIVGTTFTNTTGLTNGVTYYYKVAAVNTAGTSGQSNEASATPVSPQPPPTGITPSPGNGSVVLYWNAAPGASGYNIYRSTTPGGEGITPVQSNWTFGLSWGNSGLTNGTTYYYTIAAIYGSTTSNQSAEVSAVPTSTPLLAPTGLAAAGSNGQVTLTWNAASGALSYNVYRASAPNYEGSTPLVSGLTSPTYTNTGLTNGTAYFYRVSAVYSGGQSAQGTEVTGVPNNPQIPPVPTGVTATGGNGQVTVAWTASSGATSYNLYRSTTPGGEGATPLVTGITTTSYTNTGLTNGTTYYYKVAAVNSAGTSGQSAEVSATPSGLPAAPTGVTATAGTKQVTVAWTAVSGATSYNVYRSTTAGGEGTTPVKTGVTSTSWTNTGLTSGKKYFFKVAAVNSAGTGPQSSEVSATPR